MKKYSETHEWVEAKGDTATVGITKHAIDEIGEVVFIDLPKVGQELQSGQIACVLESTKAAIDITTPISGKVIEVNTNLKTQLHLLNQFPEKEGWLFEVKLSDVKELLQLLSQEK